MSKLAKFSIVTPSYNQADYIGETIESVLSQEGDFEIEYFVMDGGSTDDSVEIIKNYADRVTIGDWPVRCRGLSMEWISQKDNGQSDAINQGLRRATGNILSYLNSDDLYAPGAFARVAQAFAKQPNADFIYGDGDVIDETGNIQWEWLSRPYNHSVMTSYHFLWNDFTNYIMQQATFWRREVLNAIGYFDESFHYAMDVEYWIRAGHAGLALHHIAYKLGKFRLIQGTKSLSSPTVFWEDFLEIYRRYRGSHRLAPFLGYYYFNLARQFGFDLKLARHKGQEALKRWQALSSEERTLIAHQDQQGYVLASYLLASELYRQQRYQEATTAFKIGLKKRPLSILRPVALNYLLKRVLGNRLARSLDQGFNKIILTYRRIRFDYRYHQNKKSLLRS
jgi:glycosyltransferase involved in cell wall biosynthesis